MLITTNQLEELLNKHSALSSGKDIQLTIHTLENRHLTQLIRFLLVSAIKINANLSHIVCPSTVYSVSDVPNRGVSATSVPPIILKLTKISQLSTLCTRNLSPEVRKTSQSTLPAVAYFHGVVSKRSQRKRVQS